MKTDAAKLKDALATIEALKSEIRDLGDLADVCTFPTLREICKGCRCGRGRAEQAKERA